MEELLQQLQLLSDELMQFEVQYEIDKKIIHDRIDKIILDIEKMKNG